MPRDAGHRGQRVLSRLSGRRPILPGVSAADPVTRPVGPEDLSDLATLFGGNRNTRRCWCTAFCTTRRRFAAGWLAGRNQQHFESLARDSTAPHGGSGLSSGEPVGWCACGPRARYAVADRGRSKVLRDRDRREDLDVWLVACLFVRPDHRGEGITYALVRACVELARREGARAVEGWPVTGATATRRRSSAGRGCSRTSASAGGRATDPAPLDHASGARRAGPEPREAVREVVGRHLPRSHCTSGRSHRPRSGVPRHVDTESDRVPAGNERGRRHHPSGTACTDSMCPYPPADGTYGLCVVDRCSHAGLRCSLGPTTTSEAACRST